MEILKGTFCSRDFIPLSVGEIRVNNAQQQRAPTPQADSVMEKQIEVSLSPESCSFVEL